MDERLVENTICIYVWFKKEINYENSIAMLGIRKCYVSVRIFM